MMKVGDTTGYRIDPGDFTIPFASFAVLLGVALMAAETQNDQGIARTVYTIWVTAALVTPALCAFVLPGNSERIRNTWLLFWTFAFLVYLVHLGYAIFSVYHGSMQEFLGGQGKFAAVNNLIFTVWWLLDVLLAWFYHRDARWLGIERVGGHIYIALTFIASTVFLKHGFINVIGIVLTASVIICLMVRFDAWRRAK